MIVEWAMNLGKLLVDSLFMMLDILPDFPQSIINAINTVFNIMYSGVNLLGIFVDLNMVKILIPFVIAILNFDRIIKIIIFTIRKIPFISVE